MTTIDGGSVDVDARELMRGVTLRLRLRHARVVSLRTRIASILVGLANLVAPCRLEIVEAEPPKLHHDVQVERAGAEMRLVVGEHGVRLNKRDADYIGGLLTARWPGVISNLRADDLPPLRSGDGAVTF